MYGIRIFEKKYHMKQSILLTLFLAFTFYSYSQKVKMSEEARSNYVDHERVEDERPEEKKMVVYAILRAESEVGSDFMQLNLEEGSREIVTKASMIKFPELVKVTRAKLSLKSEVDLLNYLAENDWEVVTIENESDKKRVLRKYYLRKMIAL